MPSLLPEFLREYNFSDGVLEQLSDLIIANLERDLATLADRGISQAVIDNIKLLREDFGDTPTDEEAIGKIGVAVSAKENARDTLLLAARRLRTAAQNVFGEDSARYKRFGFDKMDKLTDDKLSRALRKMRRVGGLLQPQLNDEGITPIFLNELGLLNEAFVTALDNIDIAEDNRIVFTEARAEKGNKLYREVARAANIGKDAFFSINEADYNDYVIQNFVERKARKKPEGEPEG